MLPTFKMELVGIKGEDVALNLPSFSRIRLPFASAELFHVDNGSILKQSYETFLKGIDVFEFSVTEERKIDFSLDKPATYFVILIRGHASLLDAQNNTLSKIDEGTCSIFYTSSQMLSLKVSETYQKMIMLPLHPDWMKDSTEDFPEFDNIVVNYYSLEKSFIGLPASRISTKMMKAIEDIKLQSSVNAKDIGESIRHFRKQMIRSYHDALVKHSGLVVRKHALQAQELKSFIEANLTHEVLNNIDNISEKLSVPKRTLARLANETFGISIWKYITAKRLDMALELMSTTNLPITEIAASLCYTDINYFKKIFKNRHGMRPNQIIRPFSK